MKKKFIFTLVLGSIAMSLATLGFIGNKTANIAYAGNNEGHLSTGFYQKVTDIDRLENGDKIVLVQTWNREIFSYFGGNPAYACCTENEKDYFTNDNKYVGLKDSEACEFTLSKVSDGNSYYYQFRGHMTMCWSGVCDVLMAHCPYDYTDFDSIAYFVGHSLGAYKYNTSIANDEKTKWTITQSGEALSIVNRSNSSVTLNYTIYRKVDIYLSFSSSLYSLDYKDYFIGDKLNLHGLTIEVYDNYYNTYTTYKYENNQNLIYMDDYYVKANQTKYTAYLRGLDKTNYPFEFYINTPETAKPYYFSKYNITELKDYRGSYLAAIEIENMSSNNLYLPARYASYPNYWTANAARCTMENGNIPVENRTLLHEVIIIDLIKYENQYHYIAKTKDDRYFNNPYYDNDELWRDTSNYEFIELTDEVSPSNFIEIKEVGNNLTFGFKSMYDDEISFCADTQYNTFYFDTKPDSGSRYSDVYLYKLAMTDEVQDEIDDFINDFYTQTANCDATGDARYIFSHHWERLEIEFNIMSADARGYLANLNYTHNAENHGTAEDIIDRYDYILSKYDDLWDFMGRKDATTHQDTSHPSSTTNLFNNLNDFNSSTAIAIILVVALTSATVLFIVIKKRKQQ